MAKKYDLVVNSVNELLKEYTIKLTLRQIYYRLVSKLILQNRLNEYKYLSKTLVKARERNQIDWRRIEDRTRSVTGGDGGWDSEEDFYEWAEDQFMRLGERFKLTMWDNQPLRLEVWIEKDALTTTFKQVTDGYNITLCPSRGYPSFTYIAKAVSRLAYLNQDIPLKILYFGDHDPSGLDIQRDVKARLYGYGLHRREFTIERIAITPEQIEQYDIPPFPAKKSDARFEQFLYATGSDDAVELDAIEPIQLQQIVREAIEENIDAELWNDRLQETEEIKEKVEKTWEDVEILWPEDEEE